MQPISSSSNDPLHRFSPEFRLVLLCLQWPHTDARLRAIAAAAQTVHDWQHVDLIAARHRVVGLVYMGLSAAHVTLPQETASHLKERANAQTRFGFLLTMETARIGKALAADGIQPIFLKGSALTQAIYGNTSLRFSKDVDLLVAPEQVPAAVRVLQAAGFVPTNPQSAEPQHLPTWIRYGKAMDWHAPASGIYLELHWRLTDLPLLRSAVPEASLQQVTIAPGEQVSTLAGDALIAYLCVHGASHGWGRLKWLADVFALLPQDDPEAVEALFRRTLSLDAGRAVAQAMLLCRDLLGLSIGRVAYATEDDHTTAFLRTSVLRLLRRGNEVAEVHQQPFGTTGVYLSRFLIGSGSDAILSEARTWTHRPEDVAQWTLPHSLLFLLPLKQLGRWIARRIRHGGRSLPHE